MTDYEIGLMDAGLCKCRECGKWFDDFDDNKVCYKCILK